MNYKKQEEDTDKMKVVSIRRAFLDELKALEGWRRIKLAKKSSKKTKKKMEAIAAQRISFTRSSAHMLVLEVNEEVLQWYKLIAI